MNIGQKRIRSQISAYLSSQSRSRRFIRQFKEGYCNGLAVVGIYAAYLSSMSKSDYSSGAIDNWEWFESTLIQLDTWETRNNLPPAEICADIDRLIAHIEYFQHIHDYLPIGQSSLHKSMFDTRGRRPTLEFSIGGLFTAAHFTERLQIDSETTSLLNELLKNNRRLILINTGRHTTSLLRNGNQIYFYNPNHKTGRQTFSTDQTAALVKAIFAAYSYRRSKPSPLGFRIFSFDNTVEAYVAPEKILAGLSTPQPCKMNHRGITGLHVAACIGNTHCISHFLQQGIDVNTLTAINQTALYLAVTRKHDKTVEFLVKAGAKINYPNIRHKTPLIYAALKQDMSIVVLLLIYGCDADFNSLITCLTHLNSKRLRAELIDAVISTASEKFFGHPHDAAAKIAAYRSGRDYNSEIDQLLSSKVLDECHQPANQKYLADIFRLYRGTSSNHQDIPKILKRYPSRDFRH